MISPLDFSVDRVRGNLGISNENPYMFYCRFGFYETKKQVLCEQFFRIYDRWLLPLEAAQLKWNTLFIMLIWIYDDDIKIFVNNNLWIMNYH